MESNTNEPIGSPGPSNPSPGIESPKKSESLSDRTRKVAQDTGIASPQGPGEGVVHPRGPDEELAIASLHALTEEPIQPIPQRELVGAAQLAAIALRMKSGVSPTPVRETPVTQEPHLFTDLTGVMEKSPENARDFLVRLASLPPENVREAREALQNFASSDWFAEVLANNPDVGHQLVVSTMKLLGPPTWTNRGEWNLIQEVLKNTRCSGEEKVVGDLLEGIPHWDISSLRALQGDGISFAVGDKNYRISPQPVQNETQSFRIEYLDNGTWKEAGGVTVDSRDGTFVSSQEPGHEAVEVLPPTLMECMKASVTKLNKMIDLQNSLIREGVKESTARQLSEKWANEWKGCFIEPPDPKLTVLDQYRGPDRIRGLKICGPRDQRFADFTVGEFGSGSYKKAKKVIRISAEGKVSVWARYAKISPEKEERFHRDISQEIDVRRRLAREGTHLTGELSNTHLYDHLLPIEELESHRDSSGAVVRRYKSAPAAKTLETYLFERKPDPATGGMVMVSVSEDERKKNLPELLNAALAITRALRHLHARGFVHRDLKTENVLKVGNVWKLADYGLTTERGVWKPREMGLFGTPPYMPFEAYEGAIDNPSRDMFSLGLMLLEISDPKLADELAYCMTAFFEPPPLPFDECKANVVELQKELVRRGGDLWNLIAELIDIDPARRPTSDQVEPRLQMIQKSLLGDRRSP
jgi:serine/threonine protein kinase